MQQSKELVKEAGIIPALQLVTKLDGGGTRSTGPHTVKVISEERTRGTDFMSGKERDEMKYILEENGEKKYYRVPIENKDGELHYLIQRFAEVEEGEEIILEAKSQGGRTFISLERITPIIDDSGIPTIEDENQQTTNDPSEPLPKEPMEGEEQVPF